MKNQYSLLLFTLLMGCAPEYRYDVSSYAELNSGIGREGRCEGVREAALSRKIPFSLEECTKHVSKPKYKIGQKLKRLRDPDLYGPNSHIVVEIRKPIYLRKYTGRTDLVGNFTKGYFVKFPDNPYAERVTEEDLDSKILKEIP